MRILLVVFLAVGIIRPVGAAEAAVHAEINYLLAVIERSEGRFIRGGAEYTASEGAEHMRVKLKRAGGRIKTADEFIEGVATRSYLTGAAYLVRLPNGKTVATGPWLTEALAAFRAGKLK